MSIVRGELRNRAVRFLVTTDVSPSSFWYLSVVHSYQVLSTCRMQVRQSQNSSKVALDKAGDARLHSALGTGTYTHKPVMSIYLRILQLSAMFSCFPCSHENVNVHATLLPFIPDRCLAQMRLRYFGTQQTKPCRKHHPTLLPV